MVINLAKMNMSLSKWRFSDEFVAFYIVFLLVISHQPFYGET